VFNRREFSAGPCLDRPVRRASGLVSVHQLAQRLLAAGDRRVDDRPHWVIWRVQRGQRDGEQDVLLADHLLEHVDQFLGDRPAMRLGL